MIEKKGQRSGHRMLGLWVPLSDHQALKTEAASNGCDLSTLLRLRLYGTTKGMRVTRKPTNDMALLGNMLNRLIAVTGELNKVGSNINQIARNLNSGSRDAFGLDGTLRHLERLAEEILKVLEHVEAAITGRRKNHNPEA